MLPTRVGIILDDDKVLYVDEERVLELGNLAKLELLGGLSQLGLNGIIHQSNNIGNEKRFEKPISLKEAKKKAKQSQENYQATSNATTSHSHNKR